MAEGRRKGKGLAKAGDDAARGAAAAAGDAEKDPVKRVRRSTRVQEAASFEEKSAIAQENGAAMDGKETKAVPGERALAWNGFCGSSGEIASREEVLACLTACMRGEDISRAQARAAELLARMYGMASEGIAEGSASPRIVDDIPYADHS